MQRISSHYFIPLILLLVIATATNAEQQYRVIPEESAVYVYTEKAGLAGFLGHRHLISLQGIEGHGKLSEQSIHAELRFYPHQFVVDDPVIRQQQQDKKYQGVLAESAITGTRKNMLGNKLLDAEHYPNIDVALDCQQLEYDQPLKQNQYQCNTQITIKGQSFSHSIKAIATEDDNGLSVSAQFSLNHQDLGLTPFSAAGGSLKVAPPLTFNAQIVAKHSAANTQNE